MKGVQDMTEDDMVKQIRLGDIAMFDLPDLDQMHIFDRQVRAIVRTKATPCFTLSKYRDSKLPLIRIPDAQAIYLEACKRGLLGLLLAQRELGIKCGASIEDVVDSCVGIAIGKYSSDDGISYTASIDTNQASELIDESCNGFMRVCGDLINLNTLQPIHHNFNDEPVESFESCVDPRTRCDLQYRKTRIERLEKSIDQAKSDGKRCLIEVSRIDSDIKDLSVKYNIPIVSGDTDPETVVDPIIFCCHAHVTTSIVCSNPICAYIQLNTKLMKCAKCLKTLYCSKHCQHAHWKEHKITCVS